MSRQEKPLLLLDVDGVISVFGFDPGCVPAGQWLNVDGIVHLLSATAGEHLRQLAGAFELAWCTGWEEKANEYLRPALELPGTLPWLRFDGVAKEPNAHWKLAAIDTFAGPARPVAWIDDAHDHACHAWALARRAPTLLVGTQPSIGMTAEHVRDLLAWASRIALTD
jgi:hypothetical protein